MKRPRLGELLVTLGLLRPEQLEAALEEQRRTGDPLGQILLRRGFIREEDLMQALADQQRAELISLREVPVEPEAVALLNPRFGREKRVLPFRLENGRLHVAMAHPSDLALLDELRFRTGKEILPYLAPDSEILAEWDRILSPPGKPAASPPGGESARGPAQTAPPQGRLGPDLTLEASPVVELAERLLLQAVSLGASDLHLEPRETHLAARVRVDGAMQDLDRLAKDLEAPLVARFKILAGMDIAEKRRPQDGHFTYLFEGKPHEIRVASIGTLFGEKLVLRIIYPRTVRLGLPELGMLPEELERFEKLLKNPYGILFVTGPTGSGKTTTLYAALSHIHTPERTFVTIEDPVEVPLEGITQIPVQPKIGLGFAEVLRAVLRQDPDVIMVGEVRDQETLDTALRAALTGHFVLATLHANDALSTPVRLLEMGAEPYLVASTLVGVVAQRLVRRVCPQCAAPMPVPEEARLFLGPQAPETEMRGQGCGYCRGTGYRGRMGIFEVLSVDRELRTLVAERASETELRRAARARGHRDLWEAALTQVRSGQTTTQEVLRTLGLREV